MSDGLQQRFAKAKEHDDPLSKLDEDASAEPLDEAEQDAVIERLREANEKSNFLFRALMLIMLGLVMVLYVTPLPDYLLGRHPESHLTMFFTPLHVGEGSHHDLVQLPAWPLYLVFLALQGSLLFGAAYETMDRMGYIKSKGTAFPRQPHQFGTCPGFLVPVLSDIRWHPSHMGVRADSPEYKAPAVWSTMGPRLLYLCFITLVSFPLPLMTFGAGNFVNAGWWALASAALVVLCVCESMMDKFEREAVGLGGMKYSYKGA